MASTTPTQQTGVRERAAPPSLPPSTKRTGLLSSDKPYRSTRRKRNVVAPTTAKIDGAYREPDEAKNIVGNKCSLEAKEKLNANYETGHERVTPSTLEELSNKGLNSDDASSNEKMTINGRHELAETENDFNATNDTNKFVSRAEHAAPSGSGESNPPVFVYSNARRARLMRTSPTSGSVLYSSHGTARATHSEEPNVSSVHECQSKYSNHCEVDFTERLESSTGFKRHRSTNAQRYQRIRKLLRSSAFHTSLTSLHECSEPQTSLTGASILRPYASSEDLRTLSDKRETKSRISRDSKTQILDESTDKMYRTERTYSPPLNRRSTFSDSNQRSPLKRTSSLREKRDYLSRSEDFTLTSDARTSYTPKPTSRLFETSEYTKQLERDLMAGGIGHQESRSSQFIRKTRRRRKQDTEVSENSVPSVTNRNSYHGYSSVGINMHSPRYSRKTDTTSDADSSSSPYVYERSNSPQFNGQGHSSASFLNRGQSDYVPSHSSAYSSPLFSHAARVQDERSNEENSPLAKLRERLFGSSKKDEVRHASPVDGVVISDDHEMKQNENDSDGGIPPADTAPTEKPLLQSSGDDPSSPVITSDSELHETPHNSFLSSTSPPRAHTEPIRRRFTTEFRHSQSFTGDEGLFPKSPASSWRMVESDLYKEFMKDSDSSDSEEEQAEVNPPSTPHNTTSQSSAIFMEMTSDEDTQDHTDYSEMDSLSKDDSLNKDTIPCHDKEASKKRLGSKGEPLFSLDEIDVQAEVFIVPDDDEEEEEEAVESTPVKKTDKQPSSGIPRRHSSSGEMRRSPPRKRSSTSSSSRRRSCSITKEEEEVEEVDEEMEGEDDPVDPIYDEPECLWSCGNQEYDQPTSMVILPNGKVVVANNSQSVLQFYDESGELEFPVDGVKPFSMVANSENHLIVGDRKKKTVVIVDEFGSDVCMWEEGLLDWVSGLGVLSCGDVAVYDRHKCQVKMFKPTGQWISQFGSYGQRDNQFTMADFLTIDSKDRIIVADSGNHCVKAFDRTGKLLLKFGSRGRKRGQLEWPKGICVDNNDNIIVADMRNFRVCLFSPEGVFVQYIARQLTYMPYSVTFSAPNKLGVTHFTLDGLSDIMLYNLNEASSAKQVDQSTTPQPFLETMV